MGNNYNCLIIVLQVSFKPFNRWQIQVVRGLIQKHNVRTAQKQFDKSHLCLLSSGKCSDRAGNILQVKAKLLEHRFHITPICIASHCLHLILQRGVLIHPLLVMIGFHDVCKFFHPAFTGKYLFKHLQNFIFYRNFLIFKADLPQIANLLTSGHTDTAGFITVNVSHGNIPGDQF